MGRPNYNVNQFSEQAFKTSIKDLSDDYDRNISLKKNGPCDPTPTDNTSTPKSVSDSLSLTEKQWRDQQYEYWGGHD